MAWIFVPNDDGSFTEGDRQTNPETGIEYIYTDGAWRALGPKIEDEFDKLDERYVKTEGSSRFKGDLYLDPPANGITRFRLMEGNTPHQFQITSHPYVGGQLSDAKIHITVKNKQNEEGNQEPETIIDFLKDPTKDRQAVSRRYADERYLNVDGDETKGLITIGRPVTGTVDGHGFTVMGTDEDGVAIKLLRTYHNGTTLNTDAMYYAGRMDNEECLINKKYVDDAVGGQGPFLPISGGTLTGNLTIGENKHLSLTKENGDLQFKILTNKGDYFTNIYGFAEQGVGGLRLRVSSDQSTGGTYGTGLQLKQEQHTVGGSTYDWKTEINYVKIPTVPGHAANKHYVDNHKATAKSGTSAPVLKTGELFYNTSTRQLFIGE